MHACLCLRMLEHEQVDGIVYEYCLYQRSLRNQSITHAVVNYTGSIACCDHMGKRPTANYNCRPGAESCRSGPMPMPRTKCLGKRGHFVAPLQLLQILGFKTRPSMFLSAHFFLADLLTRSCICPWILPVSFQLSDIPVSITYPPRWLSNASDPFSSTLARAACPRCELVAPFSVCQLASY
jgi:hypothetical protein